MFSKIIVKLIIVGIAFLFLFSVNIYAQETEEPDSVLKERVQLIQASKRMSEEEKI